jgi:sporulation protein YlmC with PRC-barrel domain
MLQLSAHLLSQPVLSLRTGSVVAWTTDAIINPHILKIEGFYCKDSVDGRRLVLLYQDIREYSKRGFIIDDHDVLSEPDELVRLQNVLSLNFRLLKKPVVTTSKVRVGKVSDYAVETMTMYIQKLYVSQSLWRNLMRGSLSVDRTQIVEVTTRRIVINELLQPTPSPAATAVAT